VALLCDLAMEIVMLPPTAPRDFGLADTALRQAEEIQSTNANRVTYVRALWLFQSGHPEDGLVRARQALALTTNPDDKGVIELGIKGMEQQLEAGSARHAAPKPPVDGGSGGTNAPATHSPPPPPAQ
jgi:hypothetical protein